METEPRKEHHWLQRLVGEWEYESEVQPESGEQAGTYTGTEQVRSLGELWVLCEANGETPGGNTATTLMTLGYDPERSRFTGTFVGSMMATLWILDGELDPTGFMLSLDSEGPSFTEDGGVSHYRDIIEIVDDSHRILRSCTVDDHGHTHTFMITNYRRVG